MTLELIVLSGCIITFAAQIWVLKRESKFVENRVKAEIGKWAFTGGAGGAIAVWQYCVRCAEKSSVWSMIPDEGPICAKCIEKSLNQ